MEREGEEGEAAAHHSYLNGRRLLSLALLVLVGFELDWIFSIEQVELCLLSPFWRLVASTTEL